jgi:hypothetical protein
VLSQHFEATLLLFQNQLGWERFEYARCPDVHAVVINWSRCCCQSGHLRTSHRDSSAHQNRKLVCNSGHKFAVVAHLRPLKSESSMVRMLFAPSGERQLDFPRQTPVCAGNWNLNLFHLCQGISPGAASKVKSSWLQLRGGCARPPHNETPPLSIGPCSHRPILRTQAPQAT